jgi:hypothetical protein
MRIFEDKKAGVTWIVFFVVTGLSIVSCYKKDREQDRSLGYIPEAVPTRPDRCREHYNRNGVPMGCTDACWGEICNHVLNRDYTCQMSSGTWHGQPAFYCECLPKPDPSRYPL